MCKPPISAYKLHCMNRLKQKQIKQTLFIFITLITVFVVGLQVELVNKKRNEESIKKHWKLFYGTITDICYPMKSADYIQYKYFIKDNCYSNHYSQKVDMSNKLYFLSLKGKSWTIIVDTTNLSNSELLLRYTDYLRLGIPYSNQEILKMN